jgi:hypothetical protein
MKGSEQFKQVIQDYLNESAKMDPIFAKHLQKEGKNIDDCVTYICNWAKNGGLNGYSDNEIYGQAIHYYIEDNIEVGTMPRGQVISNRHIELTEEEKAEAKEKALEEAIQEEKNRLKTRNRASVSNATPANNTPIQASLF